MSEFRGAVWEPDEDYTALGLLSAALAANHSTPTSNQIFVSENMYNTLKNITFDDNNLKP